MNSNGTDNRRRALSQPGFIVVVAVLLLSAIAFNTATQALRLHFKKEAVPQPRDWHDLPPLLGQWLQVSEDAKLDKETQDALATDKYVFRDFVNVNSTGEALLETLVGGDADDKVKEQQKVKIRGDFAAANFEQRVKMIQDAMKSKSEGERKQAIAVMESQHPEGMLNMALTYYTGLVDTVAHIPDRCYLADGYDFDTSGSSVATWTLHNGQATEVRFMSFEDQTGQNRAPRSVAYFFHVDGKYVSDPLDVRRSLQSLTQKYGYYAKIELMMAVHDPAVATASMTDFLSGAKSQIETCLPDWQKVIQSGK